MPKALIFGANGQDATYLAELLIAKNYKVYGTLRRSVNKCMDNVPSGVHLLWATLENYASICKVIHTVKPDEVYHLAAQSFVTNSFQDEFSTMSTNIEGTHYILNALKEFSPKAKLYFAGTSEMFGNQPAPQSIDTPMAPVSPYGISKLAGYNLCNYYRDAFKMFISCGILFNHESPRRGKEFVTQKICQAAKRREIVILGNILAKRDWGYAKDYVEYMWEMLQLDKPCNKVVATGETHTVEEFAKEAYRCVGLDYQKYILIDAEFKRPNELNVLIGKSDFKPKTTFRQLVQLMMK